MNHLITVSFHRQQMIVLENSGKRWVALKLISDALGLTWGSQFNRLKRDPVLSTCIFMMKTQIPGDDQTRDVLFLDLDYLNGWLFGIDAGRVKEELRPRVIEYQRECYKALAEYFGGQERRALQAAEDKQRSLEKTYFSRYPRDREIRTLAIQGNPFWYIAERVCCHPSTVSTATRRMVAWSILDARAMEVGRMGMRGYWACLRKHRRQLTLNLR